MYPTHIDALDPDSLQEGPDEANDQPTGDPLPAPSPAAPFSSLTTVHLPQSPPLRNISLPTLTRYFMAPDLIPAINTFLGNISRQNNLQMMEASEYDIFNVYKVISLQVVPAGLSGLDPFIDRLRSTPARVDGVLPSLGVTPTFDTVLIRWNDRVRVARLRVIFTLPSRLLIHQEPVAYVELFSELPKQVQNDVKMLVIQKDLIDKRQVAAIIPLTAIIQSCHLIPVMPNDMLQVVNALDTIDRF